MNLFHCPWLHQLPEPSGHFSNREPRRFGSRRRNHSASGIGACGPPGDGDDGAPRGPFGTDGW